MPGKVDLAGASQGLGRRFAQVRDLTSAGASRTRGVLLPLDAGSRPA